MRCVKVTQVLIVLQNEGFPLTLWQLPKRPGDRVGLLSVLKDDFSRRRGVFPIWRQAKLQATAPPETIPTKIESDRMHPGVETRGPGFPGRRHFPNPKKGFLYDVFCFHPISEEAHRQGKQARQLCCDKSAYSVWLAKRQTIEQRQIGIGLRHATGWAGSMAGMVSPSSPGPALVPLTLTDGHALFTIDLAVLIAVKPPDARSQ